MMSHDKMGKEEKPEIKGIDASVLGQIMVAQNVLFVLPARKNIAEFFAKSLSSIPGVESCRVCIGSVFSQQGIMNTIACNECENTSRLEEDNPTVSRNSSCKLETLPNSYVFALETMDHWFGFFIFSIEQSGPFELYKPFVNNLGNFVALSLENRLQKSPRRWSDHHRED